MSRRTISIDTEWPPLKKNIDQVMALYTKGLRWMNLFQKVYSICNANIRVITVVDANRTVLARQTLGLCRTRPVGVLFGPIYPRDCSKDLKEAITNFRSDFLRQTHLTQVTSRQHPEGVEMTCAEAYNKVWQDADGK